MILRKLVKKLRDAGYPITVTGDGFIIYDGESRIIVGKYNASKYYVMRDNELVAKNVGQAGVVDVITTLLPKHRGFVRKQARLIETRLIKVGIMIPGYVKEMLENDARFISISEAVRYILIKEIGVKPCVKKDKTKKKKHLKLRISLSESMHDALIEFAKINFGGRLNLAISYIVTRFFDGGENC